MLIHNCAVTQRDIDIVMGHFTAPVTWVLCPRSNRYISNTVPPIQLLRKNGLSIAIGTDSLASNETLSMVREMAEIKDVPLEELLRWATINGAKADGSDCALGTIEVGKIPGIALLTGVNLHSLSLTESSRAIRLI
jgi:cytosine/adenosine deaminase-related metal-dependent hydrolase